jgi:hypothetical protein
MDVCFTRCQLRFALGTLCGNTFFPALKMQARCIHVCLIVSLCQRHGLQHNAIDRAGRYAAFATGAIVGDYCVHQFVRTDDGIDRANLDAFSASNAVCFDDARQRARFFDTVFRVQRYGCVTKQRSKLHNARIATRWASIDVGVTVGDRLSVRATTVIAALFALRLRQQGIDAVGERCHGSVERIASEIYLQILRNVR